MRRYPAQLLGLVAAVSLCAEGSLKSELVITQQPQSLAVRAGKKAQFSVKAEGAAALTYQWFKNGKLIFGAISPTYTTRELSLADDGSKYMVRVIGLFGRVFSDQALLTVLPPAVAPSIVSQPQGQSVCPGDTAVFSVEATGTAPFSYQWFRDQSPIQGAIEATFSAPAVKLEDDGSVYHVVVSNEAGTQESAKATLNIKKEWADVTDWNTHQGNNGRTGYVPVRLDPANFKAKWTAKPFGEAVSNQAATGDGKVFVSNSGYFGTNIVAALDESTGNAVWTYDVGAIHAVHPIAYADNHVYFTTSGHTDAFLWCLDAKTGDIRFRSSYGCQWERYFSPIIQDGRVIMAGGSYGGMYGFDAKAGQELWFANTNQYDEWAPVCVGDKVFTYTGSYNPCVTAHNPVTGEQVYSIPDPEFSWNGWSMGNTAVAGSIKDTLIAIQNGSGRLINFDLDQKAIRWTLSKGYSGQPTVANGVIYAYNQQLEARSEATGELMWVWVPPTSYTGIKNIIATKNLVFVGADDATYAINMETRQTEWTYPSGGWLSISRSGSLIIAGSNGEISAIDLK